MSDILYEDEVYLVRMTDWGGLDFLHVDVKKEVFSLSEVRRGKKAFSEIRAKLVQDGVDRVFALTPSPRFASLVADGYNRIDTIDGMELIVWELKQPSPQ